MKSLEKIKEQFHLGRARQIGEALARHGLGYLSTVIGLDRFLPLHDSQSPPPLPPAATPPAHLRLFLEEMGTTFIKLGQILSTRADLLPPEYLEELSKLQDAAPPVPWEEIEETIVAELGRPVSELFRQFDPQPMAAASIGQAHAAVLEDGTTVVVKVRRPGVVEQVEEDLEIIQNLASTADRRWEFASRYDLVGIAQEFALTLRAELDYLEEGRNAERFAANFASDPAVRIPRVIWDLTTSRVLTLEQMSGAKINDLAGLDAFGIDRPALAYRASQIILKMVFEDGFFHADPHPGNFFIQPGGEIALIDFGMTGRLDERTQERLAALVLAVTRQDHERILDSLLELGVTRERVDRANLERDLKRLISRFYGRPLANISITDVLEDAVAIMREHHLHLPSNLALLVKVIVMVEGLGARLDPQFRLTSALLPYTNQLLLRQLSPGRWARRLGQASLDIAHLGVELPQQLRRIVREIERGNVEVGVRPEGFEPILRRLERIANRIILGIIAAAFINGLAVLVSVYRPPYWGEWAGTAFTFGLICAAMLGVYLAWSIFRSGR